MLRFPSLFLGVWLLYVKSHILLYNFNQKRIVLNCRTPFGDILYTYRENDSLFIQNPHNSVWDVTVKF
ncbi:hypothetical protein GCM10009007_20820 [Formosimonas limnophila]|uniref:Uncharacterized protein n=1 Tax=Formosimonas limnophila TaxID=1384487 RepID=A0A8J3CNR9_9BURK|nr:hypothetical protein GCM10009007_20820 [Formosimonas limnophila]